MMSVDRDDFIAALSGHGLTAVNDLAQRVLDEDRCAPASVGLIEAGDAHRHVVAPARPVEHDVRAVGVGGARSDDHAVAAHRRGEHAGIARHVAADGDGRAVGERGPSSRRDPRAARSRGRGCAG